MDKIFENFFGRVVGENTFQSKTSKKNGTIKALLITILFFVIAEFFVLIPINLRSPDFYILFCIYISYFCWFKKFISFKF